MYCDFMDAKVAQNNPYIKITQNNSLRLKLDTVKLIGEEKSIFRLNPEPWINL